MKSTVQNVAGLWQTAQRAGWRRIVYRLDRMARLRLLNPRLAKYRYRLSQTLPLPKLASSVQHDLLLQLAQLRTAEHLPEEWQRGEQSTLTLLNQPAIQLIPPVAWSHNPTNDPLWLFYLHGWEWAWPAVFDENSVDVLFALWHDWIDHQPIGIGLAWEPYPTARRLITWSALWHLLRGDARMAAAIQQQASYLSHHLERDLANNHLIANAKALSWVGLLFPEWEQASRWRTQGLTILWQALTQQVSGDGMHKENSTGYHVAVLQDALETALLCQASNLAPPPAIWQLLNNMGECVRTLVRPDGRLPMLNDSLEDKPLSAQVLLSFAAKALACETLLHPPTGTSAADSPLSVLPESRYVVFRNKSVYLLFDAGDLGMAHCPGHGHADALSFELWWGEQPLLIDPGVYQYPVGPWRTYFRSTAAHSTATVDGLDQSHFTGAFRVGIMAHAELLHAHCRSGQLDILARHDGYARLADPVVHQRHFQWSDNEGVIEDTFSGQAHHEITLYFHGAPSEAEIVNEQTVCVHYPNGVRLWMEFEPVAHGEVKLATGWYSRTWYRKEATPVISYRLQTHLPLIIRTKIRINE